MKHRVETLPNYCIAYVRRVGSYGPANNEVMEKLKRWTKKKNLLKSATLLAIPQDNPETTLPENCRFDACIVISKDYQIDNTVQEGINRKVTRKKKEDVEDRTIGITWR